jgi:hypothetical protein
MVHSHGVRGTVYAADGAPSDLIDMNGKGVTPCIGTVLVPLCRAETQLFTG